VRKGGERDRACTWDSKREMESQPETFCRSRKIVSLGDKSDERDGKKRGKERTESERTMHERDR
jgi:hypothetical protein